MPGPEPAPGVPFEPVSEAPPGPVSEAPPGPGAGVPTSAGPARRPARPDLSRPIRVHVIGAGGSGMSAIATVLLAMGHRVTGSDAADSSYLRHLAEWGAEVAVGHRPDLALAADLVVRSTAVPDSDAEVRAARAAGRIVWRRADVLAAISRLRSTVAVSGTHGKTTTSSMLAVSMQHLGWRPSMVVGGEITGVGPGARWEVDSPWFVVEADESDGTFVELAAEAVVVTSVEPDHLEFYGGLAGLERAFERFVDQAPGPAVLCADDPGAHRLAARRGGRPLVTYGTAESADLRIVDVDLDRYSARFELRLDSPAGWRRGRVELSVPGIHNVRNAAATVATVTALGADWDAALASLAAYRGVGRRFEWRGEAGGVSFVDGYDHLPTEVAAAIATARSGGWPRIVVVFQPHRYSRTESLWQDFADSFVGADELVVTGIYPAGETPRPGVTGRLIHDAVQEAHPSVPIHYAPDLAAAAEVVTGLLRPGDLCVTLGAGDITTLPATLQARLAGEVSRSTRASEFAEEEDKR